MNPSNNIRTGLEVEEIKEAFHDNLRSGLGRLEAFATKHDVYFALALTIRGKLFRQAIESLETWGGANARRVAYLSELALARIPDSRGLCGSTVTNAPKWVT